jgi:acid phosphatase
MLLSIGQVLLGVTLVLAAERPSVSTIQPSVVDILASQATAIAISPTSNVKGVAFDRIIQIWLENTVSASFYWAHAYC